MQLKLSSLRWKKDTLFNRGGAEQWLNLEAEAGLKSELVGKGKSSVPGMAKGGPQCLQSLRLGLQANRWTNLI